MMGTMKLTFEELTKIFIKNAFKQFLFHIKSSYKLVLKS